jgi:hypothetical protein
VARAAGLLSSFQLASVLEEGLQTLGESQPVRMKGSANEGAYVQQSDMTRTASAGSGLMFWRLFRLSMKLLYELVCSSRTLDASDYVLRSSAPGNKKKSKRGRLVYQSKEVRNLRRRKALLSTQLFRMPTLQGRSRRAKGSCYQEDKLRETVGCLLKSAWGRRLT